MTNIDSIKKDLTSLDLLINTAEEESKMLNEFKILESKKEHVEQSILKLELSEVEKLITPVFHCIICNNYFN